MTDQERKKLWTERYASLVIALQQSGAPIRVSAKIAAVTVAIGQYLDADEEQWGEMFRSAIAGAQQGLEQAGVKPEVQA